MTFTGRGTDVGHLAHDVLDAFTKTRSQQLVVEDPVGSGDLRRLSGVHRDGLETPGEHTVDVVADGLDALDVVDPRAVGRTPRVAGTDEHDVDATCPAGTGERAAGRAVADHDHVDVAWGIGHQLRSSSAIRRNCSTTSGVECAGSRVR